MTHFQFHPSYIFRFPLLSFRESIHSPEQLKIAFESKKNQEAIYIASPVLYDELQRWLTNEINEEKNKLKLHNSLNKYFSRMCSRCTPYGLFASCGTGTWDEKNSIVISPKSKRITRLDMNFVCSLTQELSKHASIQSNLLFYPNTSIYQFGNQIRFVEYKYVNNKRTHSITSVDASEYLSGILNTAKNGSTLSELVEWLTNRRIEYSAANLFIKEIIDCQLLVSELEPTITGDDFISQLTVFLKQLNKKANNSEIGTLISCFEKTETLLKKIDGEGENEIVIYRNLLTSLKELQVPLDENYLFQVDSFSDTILATIDKTNQKKILDALNFLSKICISYPNSDLEKFKSAFYERYENQEISLAEAMDTESGVGYPSKDISGLNKTIDDLQIQNKNEHIPLNWTENESILLKKLVGALEKGNSHVKFSDQDFKTIPDSIERMAPTFSVMFKMINSVDGKIQLNHVGGGSSAANLLGRFAYGDKKTHAIIKDITDFEEVIFKDKILAEISHLPESRIGNILIRPVLRKYEIPYLAKSAVPIQNQISLEDLFVSIKNNRIVLRSRRLTKEVIPRLSTAHNYNINSLPVYKFLCDLQLQDIEKPSLLFNWGALSHSFPFLPRAEYNDVVLFPATWNLSAPDFVELSKRISSEAFMGEVQTWKETRKMPRWIVLKDGDNELLVDFQNILSVKTFFNEIKKRQTIQVSEFLFDADNALIKDERGLPYTNEIIAILFNHDYKQSTGIITGENNYKEINKSIKRSFIPGSEWLNYKIYCGVKTADNLLRETIKPIVETLLKGGHIEKWFFIRYADPDIHIRLRFYNSDSVKLNEVIKLMNNSLNQMHEQGVISKVMTDTYNRELERYGHNSMEISETLFQIDSWSTLNLIQIAQGEAGDELKWQYTIKNLDSLMDCFGFDLFQKLSLTETLKTNFIAEHSTHKDLKIQLDNKFRKVRPQLVELFATDGYAAAEIIKWNKEAIQPLVDEILRLEQKGELMVNLGDLISSYMHMSVNRIFKSQQRKHEMVIYDQLYRYYKSKIAQEKSSLPHSES